MKFPMWIVTSRPAPTLVIRGVEGDLIMNSVGDVGQLAVAANPRPCHQHPSFNCSPALTQIQSPTRATSHLPTLLGVAVSVCGVDCGPTPIPFAFLRLIVRTFLSPPPLKHLVP